MKDSDYLSLYSYCTVSVGYTRTAIFDFKHQRHFFVSLEWGQLLNKSNSLVLAEIHKKMILLTKNERLSFIAFLIDQQIAYLHSKSLPYHPAYFKSIKQDIPRLKAISISVSNDKLYLFAQTIKDIGVTKLTIYLEAEINLAGFLYSYKKTPLEIIDIEMHYKMASKLSLTELIIAFPIIRQIRITDAPIDNRDIYEDTILIYTTAKQYAQSGHEHEFNYDQFLKSQTRNLFYFGRAHITAKGQVKNGKNTIEKFGQIDYHQSFESIINQPRFQKLWFATKNKIDVCCDCEYRALCLDKRVLIQRGNDAWYSEDECSYNPYLCLESKEEGYLTLEECGISSKKDGFRIAVDQFIRMKDRFWLQKRK